MTDRFFGKLGLFAAAVVLALVLPLRAQYVYVVTVTDFDGSQSTEIMSREQIAELRDRISLESRYLQQALNAARKEWAENEENKNAVFPITRIVPRKFRQEGPFSDRAAGELVDKREERTLDREFKQAERDSRSGDKSKKMSDRMLEKQAAREQRAAIKVLQEGEALELIKKNLYKAMGINMEPDPEG